MKIDCECPYCHHEFHKEVKSVDLFPVDKEVKVRVTEPQTKCECAWCRAHPTSDALKEFLTDENV